MKSWKVPAAMALLLSVALLALSLPLFAEDEGGEDMESDSAAVASMIGSTSLSLVDAIGKAVAETNGTPTAAWLSNDADDGLHYEVVLVGGNGDHIEVNIDAKSGAITEVETNDNDTDGTENESDEDEDDDDEKA